MYSYSMKSMLFEPINKKVLRPRIWRLLGCKVGTNVNIGHFVRLDFGNAERIQIGNNVVISNDVTILCHKRDLCYYQKYGNAYKLPFVYGNVIIEDGCQIGIGSIILPNVKIGVGSIVGAGSVVTKDVPAWCVAVGNPAKVIRNLDDGL